MKDQYFGDENDYRKYGLVRALTDFGRLSTGICWMLTPDDASRDGSFISYLGQPEPWRRYDPPLYDALRSAMGGVGPRSVRHAESDMVLPNGRFHSAVLQDERVARESYFRSARAALAGADLVFFDPDNGFEVKTHPRGRKKSSKYIFWDELVDAYSAGHSVLVYQHFRREPRDAFVSRLAEEFRSRLGAAEVHSFSTARVLFLLAPQPLMTDFFRERATWISVQWAGQFWHRLHQSPNEEL